MGVGEGQVTGPFSCQVWNRNEFFNAAVKLLGASHSRASYSARLCKS